jgi:membrane-bound serine protease (ClpP class)
VVLLIALLLAVLLVPSPWSIVIVVLGVVGEVAEIVWGRRLARRWRAKTGPEAMIGKPAEVVAACRPLGKVRVHGELWQARCALGADPGDTVRIESIDGLTLVVTPEAAPGAEARSEA